MQPDLMVTKTMSIRRDEFEAGLHRLARQKGPGSAFSLAPASSSDDYRLCHETDGVVTLAFRVLPPVLLGGLLRLPRAEIAIDLSGLSAHRHQTFLSAFDRTFQRGGG